MGHHINQPFSQKPRCTVVTYSIGKLKKVNFKIAYQSYTQFSSLSFIRFDSEAIGKFPEVMVGGIDCYRQKTCELEKYF